MKKFAGHSLIGFTFLYIKTRKSLTVVTCNERWFEATKYPFILGPLVSYLVHTEIKAYVKI